MLILKRKNDILSLFTIKLAYLQPSDSVIRVSDPTPLCLSDPYPVYPGKQNQGGPLLPPLHRSFHLLFLLK